MKKSQILAALALAFALGVATPVLGTANTVSAISFADASVEGSKDLASGTEVANAVAAVKANADYQKAMTIINAYETFTDSANAGKYANFAPEYASWLAGRGVNDFKMTAPVAGVTATEGSATIADVEAIIEAVENSELYKLYANLSAAANSKDKTQLINAINAYNAYQEKNSGTSLTTDTSDDTTFEVDDAVAEINGGVLTAYDGFNGKAEEASNNIAQYEAGIAVLNPAFASDLLSSAGAAAYNAAYNETTKVYNLSALKAAINDGTSYEDGNYVSTLNLNKWNDVNDVLATMTNYDKNEETTDNWKLIKDLAVAYRAATGSNQFVSAVMTELAGATVETPNYTEPRYIYSADGKVAVLGVFPEGTILEVNEVAADSEALASFNGRKLNAYDIVLKNADGSAFDLNGQAVTVSIAVTNDLDGAKSDVYYVADDGKASQLDATYADSTMTFTATHFSIYAIVERAADGSSVDKGGIGAELPEGTNTGIVSSSDATAKASVSIMAAIATALTAAGAAIVAFRRNRAAKK